MKKFRNPLILLALGAMTVCGIAVAANETKSTYVDVIAETTDEYYSKVNTSSRENLMSSLHTIISSGTVDVGYNGLYDAYKITDVKPGTNYLWDMYSDINYTTTDSRINASYKKEGDSLNREHTIPQSWFHENAPMKADLFHVYPTDGYVNNRRSSYPHADVSSATYTSGNKSKLGTTNNSAVNACLLQDNKVFEVIDIYKGDFARTYFYFATRYYDKISGFDSKAFSVFNKSFPYLNSAFIDVYYQWHINDPVSEKEINRNNAVYGIQKNRNPYIDHPEWADYIFKGIQPTPETKTLEKIEVSGTASTKSYYVGDAFDISGLTVTATFDDNGSKSTSDVTGSVKIEPTTLSLDTKYVTFSYTYNGTTKTTTYNDFTVKERPATNYGTLDNPLSVSDAKLLIGDECPSSGNYTKQQLYVRGEVGSVIIDDSTHNRKEIYVNNPNSISSTMIVESLNMTKEQYDVLEKGDEIIFHGYGYNNNGSDYIKYKDSYDPILDRNISKEAVVPVDSVTITNTKTDYYIGDTCEISATVLPSNATTKSLTYSSNNTSVATVNNAGEVSFKAAGSVTITASSNNNKTDAITFNVTKRPVPVESVIASLQPQSTSFYVGDTVNIVYEVLPENADNKHVSFSSSRESVASVDDLGNVTFNELGTAVISVISDDNYEARADITVNVVKQPVEYIPVTEIKVPSEISLSLNEEKTIGIEILPENATDKSVSWSSSDERTAIVDDTGKITGIDYGEADIVVTSNDNEDIKATIKVTVLRPITKELVEIEIENKPSKLLYDVGEEFTTTGLEVYAHYIDGTKVDITSECTVSTPDLSQAGTKVVDVTYKNGFKASFTVAVVESIGELSCEKLPLKTEYFASESFNPIGLVVKAKVNGTDQDVTSLLTYSYNFKNNPNVKAILGGRNITITVTILEGEITNEHKAADFTYIFKDKMADVETANVLLSDWKSLECKYNQLDEASKAVLKQAVTAYSNGQVSAATESDSEKIKQCVANYDEIYLAHKAEGFSDFMNRNPKAPSPTPDPTPTSNKLVLIITIAASAVVLIVVLIVVIAVASKKRGKKHA